MCDPEFLRSAWHAFSNASVWLSALTWMPYCSRRGRPSELLERNKKWPRKAALGGRHGRKVEPMEHLATVPSWWRPTRPARRYRGLARTGCWGGAPASLVEAWWWTVRPDGRNTSGERSEPRAPTRTAAMKPGVGMSLRMESPGTPKSRRANNIQHTTHNTALCTLGPPRKKPPEAPRRERHREPEL